MEKAPAPEDAAEIHPHQRHRRPTVIPAQRFACLDLQQYTGKVYATTASKDFHLFMSGGIPSILNTSCHAISVSPLHQYVDMDDSELKTS